LKGGLALKSMRERDEKRETREKGVRKDDGKKALSFPDWRSTVLIASAYSPQR